MSKLDGYDEADKARIRAIASRILAGQLAAGEIEDTPDAIRAATPAAVQLACQAVAAVNEFIAG